MKKNTILTLISIMITILILVIFAYNRIKTNYQTNNQTKEYGSIKVESYEDIKKYITENKKSMLIIGQTGCHYCEMYEPIVDSLSKDEKFDYMYIDVKKLNDEDRTKFFNSDIMIPAKCTGDTEKSLKNGFSTPLTLILEDGKSYDCIRGYKEKYAIKNSLIDAKYITEKTSK